jgi:hypothetical protein
LPFWAASSLPPHSAFIFTALTPVDRFRATDRVRGRPRLPGFLDVWPRRRVTRSQHLVRRRTYQHALAALLVPGYPGPKWSYPPTVMLIAAPFGQLDYLPAPLI